MEHSAIKFYKRNIKVGYIFSFFNSLNITQGFWMIYLASKGISLVQLGILEGLFHFVSFFMETPTGAVADLFGRKASRILGRVLYTGYILLMLFGTSYEHFFIAFIFCAVGWNLESGAGDALTYDSLLETGEESRYMKVNGWTEVIYQTAQALALVAGGWIALQSYEKLFSWQLLIIAASIAAAAFFRETSVGRRHEGRKPCFVRSMADQYVESFRTVRGNSRLLYLIVLINMLGVFTTTTFFYMQIYCSENGLRESAMGILLAVSCLLGAAGGLLAPKIESRIGERGLLIGLPLVYMALMWGMTGFSTAVAAFAFIGFFDSVMYVIFSDYINRLIPSDRRATLLSFSSMVFSLFMIIVFPLFGAIGDRYGLAAGFAAMAGVATVFAAANIAVLFRPSRRDRQPAQRPEPNPAPDPDPDSDQI